MALLPTKLVGQRILQAVLELRLHIRNLIEGLEKGFPGRARCSLGHRPAQSKVFIQGRLNHSGHRNLLLRRQCLQLVH